MSLCCGKRVRSKKTAKNTEVIERTAPEVSSPKYPSSVRTNENHLHQNESRDFLSEDSSLRRRDRLLEDNKNSPSVAVEEGNCDERGVERRGTGHGCAVVLSTFKSPPQPFIDTQSPAIDGYSDYDNARDVGLDLCEIQTETRGDFDFSRGQAVQKQSSSDSGISASTAHSLTSKAGKASSDPEAVKRAADMELDMVMEMMNSIVESTCVPAASKRSLEPKKVDHSEDAASLKNSLHHRKNLSDDARLPETMIKMSTLLSSIEIHKQAIKTGDCDRSFDQSRDRSIAGIPSTAKRPLLLHHSPTDDNNDDDASSSSSPQCVVAETTTTMSSSSVESGSSRSSPSTVPSVCSKAMDEGGDDGKRQDHLRSPGDMAASTALNRVIASERNPAKDCVDGHSNSNATQSPSRFRENSFQFATSNCLQKTKHDCASPLQSSSQTTERESRDSAFGANSAKERLEGDSSSIDFILENNSQTTSGDQFKIHRLDVLKATSKLLDFVKEIWRKQGSLHHNLPKINLLCLHLKNHLQELENFGLRLVSNASDEKRLAHEKKLHSHTKLLQNVRKGINRYIKSLEQETVDTDANEQSQLGVDDQLKTKVGNIILLTRVIPGLVRAFGSFVDDLADSSAEKSVRNDSVTSSDEGKNVTPESNGDNYERKAEFLEFNLPKNETNKRLQKDDAVQTPPALPPKQNRSTTRGNVESSSTLTANPLSVLQSDNSSVATGQSSSLSAADSSTSSESLAESVSSSSHHRRHRLDAIGSPEVVVLRRATPKTPNEASKYDNEAAYDNFSDSEISTPDIRSSGVSLTVQEKLEELRRQAKGRSVQLHTDDDGDFCDYDIPAGIMEESLPDLCESDRKLLLYYSDEMFNHWKVLDNAASAFFHCIENSQPPKVFVMHSRFVIVAGHKMTYIGDVLARNLEDSDTRNRLLDCCNYLCDRLKNGVRKTKEAALAYPVVVSLQLMVDAVKDTTDAAFELRELLFRLAYIGKADQSFPWHAIN